MKTLILKVTVPDDFTQRDVYEKYDRAMTIITIPTEEEIREIAQSKYLCWESHAKFIAGANWAINKIKNQ